MSDGVTESRREETSHACNCGRYNNAPHTREMGCDIAIEPQPLPPLTKILDERGKRYGDFGDNARLAQELKKAIRQSSRQVLSPDYIEALDLICTKICRIVTGDPHHIDNWNDIAGYATLIANRLRKAQENAKAPSQATK